MNCRQCRAASTSSMAGTELSDVSHVTLNGRCFGSEGGEWGIESFEVSSDDKKRTRRISPSDDKGVSSLEIEISDATSTGMESESSCVSSRGGCNGGRVRRIRSVQQGSGMAFYWHGILLYNMARAPRRVSRTTRAPHLGSYLVRHLLGMAVWRRAIFFGNPSTVFEIAVIFGI
jgi:hypothetical protein